jgi:hypothetical protein
MHVGIDIGRRTVTVAIVEERSVRAVLSAPAEAGALARLLARLVAEPSSVQLAALATSAVDVALSERRLTPVAAIRLAEPPVTAAPPFHAWPDGLAELLGRPGFVCRPEDLVDGAPMIGQIRARGLTSIALTAQHAAVSPRTELRASSVLQALLPGCRITLSHSLGSVGLLPRENATIINASLVQAVVKRLDGWLDELVAAGIRAPLYLVRYDGTVADVDFIRAHPFMCLGGRRAAAARGASVLSGVSQGQVLRPGDRGFSLTELQVGYPRRSDQNLAVGRVPTSLPQVHIRRIDNLPPWQRIGSDDRLLVDETAALTGAGGPIVVLSERPRVLDPTRMQRRRLLPSVDLHTVTALGAACADVGADCDRLVRGEDSAEEHAVVEEAMVRAVAAGARPDSVHLLGVERSPLSNTQQGPRTSVRLHARAVGTPVGLAR